jgi:NAD(P)-dependent dehydrogenase (short-subunit alcohol dehydrogenase family)
LLWLGASVIIAEIDDENWSEAAKRLTLEFGQGRSTFIQTGVGSEAAVANLKNRVSRSLGKVDILVNNATITPIGAVYQVPIDQWDKSYRVNLRGPILLLQAFLPQMLARDYGVIVCVSSVGEAYLGAYETLKAAQVHLSSTLDAELEGTNVNVFSIDPGVVRTPGLENATQELAPHYGKTVEEFYAISQDHELTTEAAGAGFAAAVALAPQFRGQEISSKQALLAAGIDLLQDEKAVARAGLNADQIRHAVALCRQVRTTLKNQSEGWSQRSLFERQWMLRDFKKNAGMPVERWLDGLSALEQALDNSDLAAIPSLNLPVDKLVQYYSHMQDLAKGYEKDAEKLDEQLKIIQGWQDEATRFMESLAPLR